MFILNIVITGSEGFIGTRVVSFLSTKSKFKVFRNDLPQAFTGENSEDDSTDIIQGNLTDRQVTYKICSIADVIIHLAQSNNPMQAGMDWYEDLNSSVLPSMTLFEELRNHKKKIRVIFASSGGTVYDTTSKMESYPESAPCLAASPYGAQKIMLENYLRILTIENPLISATVLRISNPYGVLLPLNRKNGLIGITMNRIKKGLPVEIWGKASNTRDYIHIEDVCRAFTCCIYLSSSYDVFNIGSGKGYSVSEVLSYIRDLSGRNFKVLNVENEVAERLPARIVLDISKAVDVLKWKPGVPIKEGLLMMIKEESLYLN